MVMTMGLATEDGAPHLTGEQAGLRGVMQALQQLPQRVLVLGRITVISEATVLAIMIITHIKATKITITRMMLLSIKLVLLISLPNPTIDMILP